MVKRVVLEGVDLQLILLFNLIKKKKSNTLPILPGLPILNQSSVIYVWPICHSGESDFKH